MENKEKDEFFPRVFPFSCTEEVRFTRKIFGLFSPNFFVPFVVTSRRMVAFPMRAVWLVVALSTMFRSACALVFPRILIPSVRRMAVVSASSTVPAAAAVSDVAVVLLAGGVGSRMKANQPKQFLQLRGKPVLMHTLELFLSLEGVSQVVLVIGDEYRAQFAEMQAAHPTMLSFANPGKERQDSVLNGLNDVSDEASLVCIHDAARPLVTPDEIYNVLRDGLEHGAAVLGVPMKATVKESEDGQFVMRTVDRSRLWEVHTPQVIKPALLREGFKQVEEQKLEVTDDVSIIEQLGLPVKITVGEYTNIKLTTPDDMAVAEQILSSRE